MIEKNFLMPLNQSRDGEKKFVKYPRALEVDRLLRNFQNRRETREEVFSGKKD